MSPQIAANGTWTVDPERSSVGWSVRHLGVSTVHGGFGAFGGVLSGERATGTVAAASVQTDDPKRDDYVRSAEFLDAEAFPELRFTAAVPDLADGSLTGELTIRDTTLPLTLRVEESEAGEDQVRLKLKGTALRRAYGLRFPQALGAADRAVTDEVEIVLDLVLVPAS